MKRLIYVSMMFMCLAAGISSCAKKNTGNEEALIQQRDSLLRVNTQQQEVLDEMTSAMAEIAACLDTIAVHEKIIVSGIDENGIRLTRRGIQQRLSILADVINEQKEKLGALEARLANNAMQIGKLNSIIEFLENSLAQKDAEVDRLKAEVSSSNYNVTVLQEQVSLMNDTIANERAVNNEQKNTIAKQENKLNEVFYIIGTEDQLSAKGIIKKEGKIFKKKKIDFSSIDKSILTSGDIRTLTKITISGKSPKILSDVPKGSYTLEKINDTRYALYINNPSAFWSANNRVLVISIKK